MAENPTRKVRIPEIARYRSRVASALVDWNSYDPAGAMAHFRTIRRGPAYQLARTLERNPSALASSGYGLAGSQQLHGGEETHFGYYVSNEYYAGLESRLRGLGGVGVVVGSDQPLDFFTMANLREVYAVDIDHHTHLVTRGYLEVGSRFHHLMGRYPKTDEYISLFDGDNIDATLGLLAAKSVGHNFSEADIDWLRQRYGNNEYRNYLSQKRAFYRDASWIGTDQNLADVIRAYEQDRIKICRGSVTGRLIPTIAREVRDNGEHVSLIYTSNAPVKDDQALRTFQKLPLTDSSLVIFSSGGSRKDHLVPLGYSFARSWEHYLFSPTEHTVWPDTFTTPNYGHLENDTPYTFLKPY